MHLPSCAPDCLLIVRLVTDLAKATGRTEETVRLAYGLNGPPPTAARPPGVPIHRPDSDNDCGCPTALLHQHDQGKDERRPPFSTGAEPLTRDA
jgi:hypothetical protein